VIDRLRAELPFGLELAALVAFALTQPVLDLFGRAPEVFVFERADRGDILAFALAFSLVPLVALWVLEAGVGIVSARTRRAVHVGLVAVAGGLVGVNVLKQVTSWSGVLLVAGAAVLAAAAAAAYVRLPPARQFLRFGSAALPAFVALFVFASPVADLLWQDAQVAAGADGDRSPPIVMVVLDELPLASIVDTEGRLDAEAYPGLARLAEATTWYRNATAVSGTTWYSVPSALSGEMPTNRLPTVAEYPDNLFTLLGDDYSFEVQEAITGMCPLDRCPREGGGRLRGSLRRGWDVYREVVSPAESASDPQATFVEEGDTPDIEFDAFDKAQPARFTTFLDRLGAAREPAVHYLHLLLPHTPWRLLPSGRTYEHPEASPGAVEGEWIPTSSWPAEQGRQRHLLQARYADGLVGELMDRMEETGLIDDAVLVVMADHGIAFRPGEPVKGNKEAEAREAILPEMAWVPLFVHTPGQERGVIDDRNALIPDILPTIAEALGLDLPEGVEGQSLLGRPRDTDEKPWYQSHDSDFFGVEAGERSVLDAGRQAEVFALGAGGGIGDDPALRPYRIGPRADLVGLEVGALEVDGEADVGATVDLGSFDDVDLASGVVPALVTGRLDGPAEGSAVALALNGRIGAVSEVFGDGEFVGLVPDDWLRDGGNEVELYLVPDRPGDRSARTLALG